MTVLKGLINEVRSPSGVDPSENLTAFFKALTSHTFDPNTFVPMANARVYLAIRVPGPVPLPVGGFFPLLSLKSETRSDGRFEIEIPPWLAEIPGAQAFLVVYRNALLLSAGHRAIEFFAPVYRSELFPLSAVGPARAQVFVARVAGSVEDGFNSAAINARIAEELPRLAEEHPDLDKVKELRASVGTNGIHFFLKGPANTRAEFDLGLTPGTGPVAARLEDDLLLNAKISNVVTSGGNVFGRLCASRQKLEAAVGRSAGAFASAFSSATIATIFSDERVSLLKDLLDRCGAFTVEAIGFLTRDRTLPIPHVPSSITVHENVLVLDLAIDYPRRPFGLPGGCAAPPPVD